MLLTVEAPPSATGWMWSSSSRVLAGQRWPSGPPQVHCPPSRAQVIHQLREASHEAHGRDAAPGGALTQMERAQRVLPERGEAGLRPGAPAIELGEVEKELRLDVPLLADEIGEAPC